MCSLYIMDPDLHNSQFTDMPIISKLKEDNGVSVDLRAPPSAEMVESASLDPAPAQHVAVNQQDSYQFVLFDDSPPTDMAITFTSGETAKLDESLLMEDNRVSVGLPVPPNAVMVQPNILGTASAQPVEDSGVSLGLLAPEYDISKLMEDFEVSEGLPAMEYDISKLIEAYGVSLPVPLSAVMVQPDSLNPAPAQPDSLNLAPAQPDNLDPAPAQPDSLEPAPSQPDSPAPAQPNSLDPAPAQQQTSQLQPQLLQGEVTSPEMKSFSPETSGKSSMLSFSMLHYDGLQAATPVLSSVQSANLDQHFPVSASFPRFMKKDAAPVPSADPALSSCSVQHQEEDAPVKSAGDAANSPKKRGRKSSRPKKPKVYEIKGPLEDKEAERKRWNAVKSKEHRDKKRDEQTSLVNNLKQVIAERDYLQQQVQQQQEDQANLVNNLKERTAERDYLRQQVQQQEDQANLINNLKELSNERQYLRQLLQREVQLWQKLAKQEK